MFGYFRLHLPDSLVVRCGHVAIFWPSIQVYIEECNFYIMPLKGRGMPRSFPFFLLLAGMQIWWPLLGSHYAPWDESHMVRQADQQDGRSTDSQPTNLSHKVWMTYAQPITWEHTPPLRRAHFCVSPTETDLCKGQPFFGADWVGQLILKQFKFRGYGFERLSYWFGRQDHANTA